MTDLARARFAVNDEVRLSPQGATRGITGIPTTATVKGFGSDGATVRVLAAGRRAVVSYHYTCLEKVEKPTHG
jgi:hypothetical protein